ncbi:MAG: DNA polymerase-2, partial [Pseudomonadales bacterium]
PEPVDALVSEPDYQHYIEKQLAPAADGILQFLDTSFSAITDAQMQMF